MINTYSKDSLDVVVKAGQFHVGLQALMFKKIKVGVSVNDLEAIAENYFKSFDCESAFLGFHGYPKHTCISINEELIHGIPGERRLKHLDIVSVDIGVKYKKMIVDGAFTVIVSDRQKEEGVKLTKQYRLVKMTYDMLQNITNRKDTFWTVNSIPEIFDRILLNSKEEFFLTPEYCGHGVGRSLHEEPRIPNTTKGIKHNDFVFQKGMVFAIEPMLLETKTKLKVLKDKWTVATRNKTLAAHFEETFIVNYNNEVESVTNFKNTSDFTLIKS